LIATAAIFVACSSNEEVAPAPVEEEVAIGFSSNDVVGSTRADIDNTWMAAADATNGKFGVYGYKGVPGTDGTTELFANEKVIRTSNDWTHTTVRYWDKNATNYHFYAYAPHMASGMAFSAGKFTFSGLNLFKAISTTAGVIDDICVATPLQSLSYSACKVGTDGTGALDGHVSFTFNHILSKLQFKYVTESLTGIASITLKKAEITIPTGTSVQWSQTAANAVAGKTSYTKGDASTVTQYDGSSNTTALPTSTTDLAASGDSYIVAPTKENDTYAIGIKVTYDIKYTDNKEEKGCVATGDIKIPVTNDESTSYVDMSFVQDYLYTVTVTVKPATIEFDVDGVKGWMTNTTGGTTVQ